MDVFVVWHPIMKWLGRISVIDDQSVMFCDDHRIFWAAVSNSNRLILGFVNHPLISAKCYGVRCIDLLY